MSSLSDIIEDALPRSTSSPPGVRSRSESPMDIQREIQEAMSAVQIEHSSVPSSEGGAYGDLAQEFGIEPQLVEALARRLSGFR